VPLTLTEEAWHVIFHIRTFGKPRNSILKLSLGANRIEGDEDNNKDIIS